MSAKMKITIPDGKRVRMPGTYQVLEPMVIHQVPKNQYWLRRIKDGDVVLCVEDKEIKEVKEVKKVSKKPKKKPEGDE